VKFEILGHIEGIEAIAVGISMRDLAYLEKTYGSGRWSKLKGKAGPADGTAPTDLFRQQGVLAFSSSRLSLGWIRALPIGWALLFEDTVVL